MFFEKIGKAIENFVSAYGSSFLVMVLAGLLIAVIIELAVKKAFKWLEEKFGDVKWLDISKMSVIFVVTIALCAISTMLILAGELPLPGNRALAPFWFGIIYLCQYIFSMYGIKSLFKIKEKEPKEKKVKEPKPKKVNPVEGMKKISRNCYKDPVSGNFFDRKGNQL